jgi:hypothetical protein
VGGVPADFEFNETSVERVVKNFGAEEVGGKTRTVLSLHVTEGNVSSNI